MDKLHYAWSCTLLVAVGCKNFEFEREQSTGAADVVDDSLDERPVEIAAEPPPPITGGTLLVTSDGAYAVASDPDRDVVHIVDLASNRETATIALPHGARPFRGAEDGAGLVHVTLRGTGQVATIDPSLGVLVSTTGVCPNPRGVAYHGDRNALLVACAGGQLVELDAGGGGVVDERFVATDLRDVFVRDGATFVTRFRTAEVLEVLDSGAMADGSPLSLMVSGVMRAPGTAWRTVPTDEGWLMLHQFASTSPLDAPPPGEEPRDGTSSDDGGGPGGGYDGGGIPCGGASNPAVTAMRSYGRIVSSGPVLGIAVAVDVAVYQGSIVVASPSQHDEFRRTTQPTSLTRYDLDAFDGQPVGDCEPASEPLAVDDFVAVAFTPLGELLALTRDDPQLYRFADTNLEAKIDLAGDEIHDTGHDLFHLDTGGGIACATCHPEGGDDGRVWGFVEQGPRRTQALNAGISGTEPFHWRGDMKDMHILVDEVRGRRMGGAVLTEDRVTALREWVFAIPLPNPERRGEDPAAARGASLFTQLGCRTCHSGPAFTSNADADLGRGPLQIPNLRGIAVRPPYMHDGRCETLSCAVLEMVATTNPAAIKDPVAFEGDLVALVAYLETL